MTSNRFSAIIVAYRKENIMDIRIRALIETLKILAGSALGGLAFSAFFIYVPMTYYPTIFMVFLISFMIYIIYSISLTQLRYKDKLKETLNTVQEK